MCASKTLTALLLLTACAALPAVAAEKKADVGKGEVKRLQQVQRQLEKEKNQLAEQKAAAESELGEARKKADGEARRAAGLSREMGALRTARDGVAAKLAESEAEVRRLQEQQRAMEAENKRLLADLGGEKQQRQACLGRVQELRRLGGEVLGLYEKKSCLESSLQREPFTGLKRVEIENVVEDLRDKLEAAPSGS